MTSNVKTQRDPLVTTLLAGPCTIELPSLDLVLANGGAISIDNLIVDIERALERLDPAIRNQIARMAETHRKEHSDPDALCTCANSGGLWVLVGDDGRPHDIMALGEWVYPTAADVRAYREAGWEAFRESGDPDEDYTEAGWKAFRESGD